MIGDPWYTALMPISLATAVRRHEQQKANQAARALARQARNANHVPKRVLSVEIDPALFKSLQDQATAEDRFLVSVVTEALTQYQDRRTADAARKPSAELS